MDFAAVIKHKCRSLKIPYSRLAADAGVSVVQVKRIAEGQTKNPGILTVEAILRAMGKRLEVR